MNFTVSTKPLADALNLGVINASVSKFYQKSCLAQLTADKHTLRINLEATNVYTELTLKGSGDVDGPVTIFVDNVLLKQLVNTFEASVTTLEFDENGLILHSGKSKFTLPKMIDGLDIDLTAPAALNDTNSTIDIDMNDWKFIRDHQMYAIAMSFITPVYTKVWLGESGDVLVGDFDNSTFTHSKKNKLGHTCLITDTIVNLFNSLPEGAKLTKLTDSYIISVITDGYTYTAEFKPLHEDDQDNGSYNSEVILDMMKHDVENAVKLNVPAVNKFLSQASLLSSGTEDTIELIVHGSEVSFVDKNVDCKLQLKKPAATDYHVKFKTIHLKPVISNLDADDIMLAPMVQSTTDGDIVVGICCWTDNMEVVIGGVEE